MLATSSSKELVIVAGRVNGTGTAAIQAGEGFSLDDDGTGDYDITFHRAYDKLVSVVVSSETADSIALVSTITHTDGTIGPVIRFLGFDATDGTTPKDIIFDFITIWEVDT